MKSSFRERLERLGPVKAVDRVHSGSPVVFRLRVNSHPINTIEGALSLARRGVTLLSAKRAMERVADDFEVTINIPVVEDVSAVAKELVNAGLGVAVVAARNVDVAILRKSLGLTQDQFALQYGLDPSAVKNWEQGRREPDSAARSYLRAIQRDPKGARIAQEDRVEVQVAEPAFHRHW